MTHHLPGPGDPATWPAYTGHPNDPRNEGPYEYDGPLECGATAQHVVLPVQVWFEIREYLEELVGPAYTAGVESVAGYDYFECGFEGTVEWSDGHVFCPWCGTEHYDDGDWT